METSKLRKRMPVSTLFDPKIVGPAIGQAFVKLNLKAFDKGFQYGLNRAPMDSEEHHVSVEAW